jgi:hypothetical protein
MPNSKEGPPLSEALNKNEEVAEEVKKAADQLAVAHAVLETRIAKDARDGEVAEAVAETREVGRQLDESAEKLEEVNEALRREVRRKH